MPHDHHPRTTPNSRQIMVRIASPEALSRLLPRMLDSLSIARGQMLVDQLNAIVESKQLGQMVVLTAEISASAPTTTAASPGDHHGGDSSGDTVAIVVLQTGRKLATQEPLATANMLFAGPVGDGTQPLGDSEITAVTRALASNLDEVLANSGVRFIQWAHDVHQQNAIHGDSGKNENTVPDIWANGLGFQRLAELVYMSWEFDRADNTRAETLPAQSSIIALTAISQAPERLANYCELVNRTYTATLDCPELSELLSTESILDGYRSSPAYSPDLWFEAQPMPGAEVPGAEMPGAEMPREIAAGCLILARHGGPPGHATEIVYMGIAPEYRGHRLGAELVAQAYRVARSEKSDRLILAVDTRNRPARAAYDAAGFVPILSEEVWCKRLLPVKIEASKNEST